MTEIMGGKGFTLRNDRSSISTVGCLGRGEFTFPRRRGLRGVKGKMQASVPLEEKHITLHGSPLNS